MPPVSSIARARISPFRWTIPQRHSRLRGFDRRRSSHRSLGRHRADGYRDALILSDPRHIDSVESAEFVARNQRELGYQPGTVGERTSPYDIVFRPSPNSARVDPLDPLDPSIFCACLKRLFPAERSPSTTAIPLPLPSPVGRTQPVRNPQPRPHHPAPRQPGPLLHPTSRHRRP